MKYHAEWSRMEPEETEKLLPQGTSATAAAMGD